MRKFAAFIFALILVVPFCFCVTAEDEDYFWLKSESSDSDISLEFEIPHSICSERIGDANCRITAEAEFTDCEGDSAYIYCCVYDSDNNLVAYHESVTHDKKDEYGENIVESGIWQQFDCEFNPCNGNYGDYDGKHIDASQIGTVTLGIGFHNAVGTIKVDRFSAAEYYNEHFEIIWVKYFNTDYGQGGLFAPKTGDNGMIAFAIVSVIALAGAFIIKKSR